jgi:hypothetical protein
MKTVPKSTGNIGLDILLQDLDLALTFLKMANTTGLPDSARRNHEKALKAYHQVVAALQAVTLSEEVQAQFDEKLSLLMSRLRETSANVTTA